MTFTPKPQRVSWVDILRIVACFMVVVSHSCDFFVARFDEDPSAFRQGAAWGSLMRACVPLFVMITGVLLLPVKEDTGQFYRRKLSRIVWPLVFWSLVTPLFYLAYGMFSWSETGYFMGTFPLNFNYTITPLWYLYMLVGVYLILPIVSPWIQQASRQDLKRFLYIWGFTLFLPAIQTVAPQLGYEGNYGHTGMFGVCDWNPFGTFYYFSGFLGYVVLAHYLVKYPKNWSWSKTLSVCLPLFIIGYAITHGSFLYLQKHYPGDYAYLEIAWYFTGFNVFMMTYAVFTIMQKLTVSSEKTAHRLYKIAGLTFGIYLCHFFIVQVVYDWVSAYVAVPVWLQVPIIAVLAFTFSAAVVRLLQLLPKSKYLIG